MTTKAEVDTAAPLDPVREMLTDADRQPIDSSCTMPIDSSEAQKQAQRHFSAPEAMSSAQ
jgi:hypothetical protein